MSRIVTISSFHASKLGNDRDIYVYLPEGYEENRQERYPVLYLQDGQNVFDNGKSVSGRSWRINRVADRLIEEKQIRKIIMVAIPSMNRSIEYGYYTWKNKRVRWANGAGFDFSIEGRGEEYADFVINQVKPYIDEHYRTLPDCTNTALMGASDGGFITFNIGIRHPDVFGRIAVMSPAFFAMDMEYFEKAEVRNEMIWLDTGEKELCLNSDARDMAKRLMDKGYVDGENLFFYYVPDGEHTEYDWGMRACSPMILFFGNAGEPVGVQLEAEGRVSLSDNTAFINPVITYVSGVRRSDLNGNYVVDGGDILGIQKDGRLVPKAPGTATVRYQLNHLVEEKEITVDAELPDTVDVSFSVQVPEDTPEDARVGIDTCSPLNVELHKEGKGMYSGRISLKRGTKITYRVRMFWNFRLLTEQSENNEIPGRKLHAMDNEEVKCRVVKWGN